jgi:MFS family permease
VLGFGTVMLAVGKVLPESLSTGLIVGGLGYGTVVPSVVKAVTVDIDQRYAGLASGIIISTFQIGAALGVAIIGGVFYGVLGTRQDAAQLPLQHRRGLAPKK